MKLYIDTSDNLKTIIKLDDQQFTKTYQSPREQDVLGAIHQAISASSITLQDITSIEVNQGPGSFTGLRVGISIANALSLSLNLPINHKRPSTTIIANYGAPPSITPSNKK